MAVYGYCDAGCKREVWSKEELPDPIGDDTGWKDMTLSDTTYFSLTKAQYRVKGGALYVRGNITIKPASLPKAAELFLYFGEELSLDYVEKVINVDMARGTCVKIYFFSNSISFKWYDADGKTLIPVSDDTLSTFTFSECIALD